MVVCQVVCLHRTKLWFFGIPTGVAVYSLLIRKAGVPIAVPDGIGAKRLLALAFNGTNLHLGLSKSRLYLHDALPGELSCREGFRTVWRLSARYL